MLKKIYIPVVLIFSTLSAFSQSLTFKNTEKDRGQTQWYQPISATFRFTNTSGEPLYIEEVDPGCACLAPEYPKGTIQPDEEGKIVITYNAELLGRFDRLIFVKTNLDEQPTLLRMKCKVVEKEAVQQPDEDEIIEQPEMAEELTEDPTKPLMALSSEKLVLGKFKPNKKLKGMVFISNTGDGYLIIEGIKSHSAALTVNDTKAALKKGQKYKVKIVLDTSKMESPEEISTFTIESNDQHGTEKTVEVQCQ